MVTMTRILICKKNEKGKGGKEREKEKNWGSEKKWRREVKR